MYLKTKRYVNPNTHEAKSKLKQIIITSPKKLFHGKMGNICGVTKETGNEYCGTDISRLIDEVRVITTVIQDQEESDTIEKEWQMLAKLLDRVFFFIFLFIYVVITLAILLPAYIHYTTLHGDLAHRDKY